MAVDQPEKAGGAKMIRPLTAERDAGICFRQDSDFSFAGNRKLVTLAPHELRRMSVVLPILLSRRGDRWRLKGVMGFRRSANAFVGPGGAWGARYTPERLSYHPLWLVPSKDGTGVGLGVTEESPRMASDGGEQLITDGGEITEAYQKICRGLLRHRESNAQVDEAANLLLEAGLLELLTEDNKLVPPNADWYQADLAGLDAVPTDTLRLLADTGALAIAYGMYYSVGNVEKMRQMLRVRRRRSGTAVEEPILFNEDDAFSFNFEQ